MICKIEGLYCEPESICLTPDLHGWLVIVKIDSIKRVGPGTVFVQIGCQRGFAQVVGLEHDLLNEKSRITCFGLHTLRFRINNGSKTAR